MGMDFCYAGSASYPRFDNELCEVAEVFGGIKTDHLKEREAAAGKEICDYWFGFLSSDDTDKVKFVFPKETDETLVKWFNNIYGDFTAEETKTVWNHVKEHPEIKEISSQIWRELETLNELNEGWYIY